MSKNLITILGTLVFVIVLSVIGLFWNDNAITRIQQRGGQYQAVLRDYRSNIQLLREQIGSININPSNALFTQINDTIKEADGYLDVLKVGNSEIEALPQDFTNLDDILYSQWDMLKTKYNTNQQANGRNLIILFATISSLRNNLPNLETTLQSVIGRLVETSAPNDQIIAVENEIAAIKNIRIALYRMLDRANDGLKILYLAELKSASSLISETQLVLQGEETDSLVNATPITDEQALELLGNFSNKWAIQRVFLSSIDDLFINLTDMQYFTNEADGDIRGILDEILPLNAAVENTESLYATNTYYNYGLWLIIVLALVGIAYVLYSVQTQNKLEAERRNTQNQNAILRLLDEIMDLSDGDLTSEVTVTEDFTGAIADSINMMITQLRGLVTTINSTSSQISGAISDSQSSTQQLMESSQTQSQEISTAYVAINNISSAINKVSSSAAQSSKVAESSVVIANKGSQIVHDTIIGMDGVREQIQDTSKRIKRLGESSQEIGDIVGLINDIADQTNILALNAAIQASMAGDAGRGFAVVADEVQRLAERSSDATKKIENIVRLIQNDTNEVIVSMEQTTTEVIRGANLAQDAGISLEEIEKVSKDLAVLINDISQESQKQASSASYVASSMEFIQDITTKIADGVTKNSNQIVDLNELSQELQKSISGFVLTKAN